jgi:hypothetical protein
LFWLSGVCDTFVNPIPKACQIVFALLSLLFIPAAPLLKTTDLFRNVSQRGECRFKLTAWFERHSPGNRAYILKGKSRELI